MREPFDGHYRLTQKWNDARYRASYYKFGLLGHNGLDFATPAWTPILAPHKGTIKEATFDSGYGNYVKVENEDEGSVLAHLAKISVQVGQFVVEGEIIGYSGNTGNSTGAHLHWGYYRTRTRDREDGFLGYLNPVHWLDIRWPLLEITGQTKIPQIDNKEVQAIVSMLFDQQKDLKACQDKVKESESTQTSPEIIEVIKKVEVEVEPEFKNKFAKFLYLIARAVER